MSDLLVVDDSSQNLEILSTLLSAHGHEVRTATGGQQALQLVDQRTPDLVLLDIHMPDLDGFEVCRTLRERYDSAQLPVVFLSAQNDPINKVKAFQLGAIDFVTKPFHFPEVLARVDTHLELKRRNRQLEEMNARLRATEEARRNFITALVHDIKNPLTPMLKNTEWLLEQAQENGGVDPEVVEVTRDLHVASNHLYRMVLSLLDVARSDQQGFALRRAPTQLRAFVADSLELLTLRLRAMPGRLVVDVEDAEASFDPAVLGRVLQNLLDNALKYTPSTESIRVSLALEGSELVMVVEDRGAGVPAAARERIFESWVQLEERPAIPRASHGIGLAFCRHAVEAHGGRITVEDAVPHGARFVVRLPRVG
ncbi:MAG: hybrid sensor histidine kinase/response regulator [Myxococcaceae bacterium]